MSSSSQQHQSQQQQDRVVGCMLGALCADALGAAVEGWPCVRIAAAFPDGLTDFQPCRDRMGRGRYTDDGQMLLALAAALVNSRPRGALTASGAATEYAKAFDPHRGYGGSAQQILAGLRSQLQQQGQLPAASLQLGMRGGSYGNGGAMRVAPLGLVYRNAPLPVLEAALLESLLPTHHHTHPWSVEGALTQALAVGYLCKQPAAGGDSQGQQPPPDGPAAASGGPPEGAKQFLRALQEQLQGRSDSVMCSRLEAMQAGLEQLWATAPGPKQPEQSWSAYLASPAWQVELSVTFAVGPGEDGTGFQIKATDAVAAALWACVAHWSHPTDAVVAAVHYGNDTDTVACMAGALMGAAHGTAWLPQQWLEQLEQDAPQVKFFADTTEPAAHESGQQQQQRVLTTRNMGREGAVVLAKLLSELDCRGGG